MYFLNFFTENPKKVNVKYFAYLYTYIQISI